MICFILVVFGVESARSALGADLRIQHDTATMREEVDVPMRRAWTYRAQPPSVARWGRPKSNRPTDYVPQLHR